MATKASHYYDWTISKGDYVSKAHDDNTVNPKKIQRKEKLFSFMVKMIVGSVMYAAFLLILKFVTQIGPR